ncbi:MAG TPA: hypothetical protein VGI20_13305 [Rhizomicrobium sp.]|jgi:hypothetical protein
MGLTRAFFARRHLIIPISGLLLAAFARLGDAPAAVVISTGASSHMVCKGAVCQPTAADAVLSVSDLKTLLESGNVTVTTTGSAVQAKSILMKANLSWSNASALTLDAYQSISVHGLVSVAGQGGLALTTNDGGTGGDVAFVAPGKIAFANLSSNLKINGTGYVLASSIQQLASDIAANNTGYFALADNYDASADGTYKESPILSLGGTFEGLGNTISNLTIYSSCCNAGLIFDSAGIVRDINLTNESVTVAENPGYSQAGGLVYWNLGLIQHTFVGGSISGSKNSLSIGGIAAFNTGTIADSSAQVTTTGYNWVGGLVGYNLEGTVEFSHAVGSVTGYGCAGGLVGYDEGGTYPGLVSHSYAAATVATGDAGAAGGLIGCLWEGQVRYSHATGDTTAGVNSAVGGLVGTNIGNSAKHPFAQFPPDVAYSYSTGNASGGDSAVVGGLIGSSFNIGVGQSFAAGSASGGNKAVVGGLIGYNAELQTYNSYSTGAVNGGEDAQVGGLSGHNAIGTTEYDYSAGAVTGGSGAYVGGLIGFDETLSGRKILDAYWDTTTSGITNPGQGAGNVSNDPGVTGLSTAQLKSGLPTGLSMRIWGENSNINNGLPYLLHDKPPQKCVRRQARFCP